jgi:hypothetical protein
MIIILATLLLLLLSSSSSSSSKNEILIPQIVIDQCIYSFHVCLCISLPRSIVIFCSSFIQLILYKIWNIFLNIHMSHAATDRLLTAVLVLVYRKDQVCHAYAETQGGGSDNTCNTVGNS